MDGEATSWIRGANYSHTVCYRMIPPSLESMPVAVDREMASGLKRMPLSSPSDLKSLVESSVAAQRPAGLNADRCVVGTEIQRNPVTNKKRSVSPSPHVVLRKSFEEAKTDIKRFSTPNPRRMDTEKVMKAKSPRKDSLERTSASLRPLSHSGPIRDLSTLKIQERTRSKKETRSSKSFDCKGSRASAMGALEEHLIDTSKVTYGNRFSHGIYSQLFHGEYKGEAIALKIIKAHDTNVDIFLGARLEKQFIKEATLLSQLSHPNVVKFVGVNTGNCIVTEYLPQGSLRSYLHKLEDRALPLLKVIGFGLDIARGMAYIHSRKIVHRDLKPENVLIGKDFKLKIADFGIACEEEQCDGFVENVGTYRWMAPEVIKQRPHGRKCDVYSFGLLLWEMLAGELPYVEMSPIQAAYAVVNKHVRPYIPEEFSVAMKELMEMCWSHHADRRPDFWQVVRVLEHFDKSLRLDGVINLMPSHVCPGLRRGPKYWVQIFGSVHPHGGVNNNHIGSTLPKPKFA